MLRSVTEINSLCLVSYINPLQTPVHDNFSVLDLFQLLNNPVETWSVAHPLVLFKVLVNTHAQRIKLCFQSSLLVSCHCITCIKFVVDNSSNFLHALSTKASFSSVPVLPTIPSMYSGYSRTVIAHLLKNVYHSAYTVQLL